MKKILSFSLAISILLCSFYYVAAGSMPGAGIIQGSSTANVSSATGTLAAANGGTGIASYTTGDLLQATGTTTISKLNSVATGNALLSGGVGTASSWGKIGLTTHVSGSLPIANGGTAGTTAAEARTNIAAYPQYFTLNAQTGAGYTLVLSDDTKLITLSNASAQNLSIPTNASVAFPVGTQITVISIGAGQWTILAANSGTTTVASTAATAAQPKLRVQYSSATLIKVATDLWYVVGDLQ